jgi:hypothetical protein
MAGLGDIFSQFFTWIRGITTRTGEQAAGFAIGQASSIALRPLFLTLAKQVNKMLPAEMLGAYDYATAYLRGYISAQDFYNYLGELGLPTETIEMIKGLKNPLLNVGEIQVLYNRKEITEAQAISRLQQLGYGPEEIPQLLKLAKYIPSVPDFVRMAVREVFTPEVAEKYGQFEDYPPAFEEYAKMAGLSPEYAKYYWAAHWELPSISMGFEMYHRGIITYEDLKTLLRTLDVMPYWREKLIKLSETPFTRIDVRRMYKAGVLTREEVTRAYMDLGYNEDKATKLTDFVCADANLENRELTKSELLTLYRERALTHDEIMGELKALGYSNEEIEFLIFIADFQKSKEKLNALKNAMKASYFAGLSSRNDVLVFLEKQAIPAAEVQELLDLWDAEREVRVTLPSIGDLRQFLKYGVIDQETFRGCAQGLGYPDQVIDWYISVWQTLAEEEKAKAEAKEAAAKAKEEAKKKKEEEEAAKKAAKGG